MISRFSRYEKEDEKQRKKQDNSISMQIVERERGGGGVILSLEHTPLKYVMHQYLFGLNFGWGLFSTCHFI